MEDESGLEPECCEFESHYSYQYYILYEVYYEKLVNQKTFQR